MPFGRSSRLVGGGRRRSVVVAVIAFALVAGQQVANAAVPEDEDPSTPATVEVSRPFWTEPEFLLTAGNERWNVRNRPAGTVAAAYGHEANAVHDDLTVTARYDPAATPTFASGTPAAGRVALDVAMLGPTDGRTRSWSVSRFSDGSVDVTGPLENGLTSRYVYAAPAPLTYVGGVVAASSGATALTTILVRSDGALVRYTHLGATTTGPVAVGSVSGPAVAAVPRSYITSNGSPRFPDIEDAVPSASSTLMMVVRADGELVPVRVSNGSAVPQAALSSGNLQLIASNLPARTLVDFDFSCVTADRGVSDTAPVTTTGAASTVVGCAPGVARSGGTADTVSLGRISVAVNQTSGSGQVVQVYTTADYVASSGGPWSVVNERRSEEACATNGSLPVAAGSFDVRTLMGVTHLACVTLVTGQPFVRDYMQPGSSVPQEAAGYTGKRDAERTATSYTIARKTTDPFWEPGTQPASSASDGSPLVTEAYANLSLPTLALQFPCASLLTRSTRSGLVLDDCDATTLPSLGENEQAAPPPPNWKTYTIAAYANTVNNQQDRRLLVANVPASASPQDRTLLNDLPTQPFGPQGPEVVVKSPADAASTTNVVVTYSATGGSSGRGQISGAPTTLDGVPLKQGQRVLLKNQTTGAQNGIWVVTTLGTGSNGVWNRAVDFDEDNEVAAGVFVYVLAGAANAGTGWGLTNTGAVTVGGAGGTALTFARSTGENKFPNYTVSNFSWTVEPSIYKASDITRVKQATETAPVDPATVTPYAVPAAATAPPLFLSAIPRPSETTVVLQLDDPDSPVRQTSPTIPIALLQAPPVVNGLGQDKTFTPAWTVTKGEGTSTAKGVQTSVGGHVDAQATFTVGAEFFGSGGQAGGGVKTGFAFGTGEEKVTSNSVDVTKTTSLYGSYDHHTVVTQTVDEWVWKGRVISDPTGLALGEPLEYRLPTGSPQKLDVWDPAALAVSAPALYGPQGLYTASLRRLMMNAVPGDPSTYAVDDTTQSPQVLLQRNGGPCIGDYSPEGRLTSVPGGADQAVRLDNPFVAGEPALPVGPSVLVTGAQAVKWDADGGASQTLDISSSRTSSILTSNSFDWSLSAIFKEEGKVNVFGAKFHQQVEISAGIDLGWSTSASLDQSLSDGTSVNATMADIPYSPDEVGDWLQRENYDWRMFMCKGQFGPAGLGTNVWVQGYLVGDYNGTGGLTDLAPVQAVAPSAGSVVVGVPAGTTPAEPLQCLATPRSGMARFKWDSPSGTMKSYTLELRNKATGVTSSWEVASWSEPKVFNDTVKRSPDDTRSGVQQRPSCLEVPSSQFVDGNTYEWRVVTQGFVENEESSPWRTVLAQVWPTGQTLKVRTPLVNSDKSVTFAVSNPTGVTSLRHSIVIRKAGTSTVVDRDADFGASYRSVSLPNGLYDATITGFNDQVVAATGKRALTPAVTVRFVVGPTGIRVLNAPAAYESKVPTSAVFMVRLDKPATRTVTVRYTTVDGTAKAGADYSARSGTITWLAGQQVKYIRVPIRQDSRREATEYFNVRLSSPTGGQLIRWATARGSIVDND